MGEEVLKLVLQRGDVRVRQLRKLLEGRISKELDALCTKLILERVDRQIEYVTQKALALSRTRCDSPFVYGGSVYNLRFLGQYFWRSRSFGYAESGAVANSQEEEDGSWRPETFPYQRFVEDGDPPVSSPQPSLDPVQFQRLDEDLRFEVLKKCSAQKLCELIGGRGNREFCGQAEEALKIVLRKEILAVVNRALALDRLHRVCEVDHRRYWECASTKLRGFPAPVVDTSWFSSTVTEYRRWSGPGDRYWDWPTS